MVVQEKGRGLGYMKKNPFRVIVPSQIPTSNRGSDNDEYNKRWIWRRWIEGSKDVNEISDFIDIHPDEVLRLMKEMKISFSDKRCSICRFRSHNISNCPRNPSLSLNQRQEASMHDAIERRFPHEEE